jgi:AraC family transcriptional activator of pyochelin receptor
MAKKPEWSLKQVIEGCKYNDLQVLKTIDRYHESIFSFREAGLIEGRIDTFITPNMEISMSNIDTKVDITTRINDDIKRTVSTFVMNGTILSDYHDAKKKLIQKSRQHSLTHLSSSDNVHVMKAGKISLLYINYKQEFIQSLNSVHEGGQAFFNALEPGNFYVSLPMDFYKVSDVLKEIYSCKFKGPVKHIFMEAKALELLALQLEELVPQQKTSEQDAINSTDKEKLEATHTFIKEQFMQSFSLKSIALKFGLNEFKLKSGYKKLFGTTVFGHLSTLRMDYARQLLETGLYNVSEVADMMGYSNAINFSAAFVKIYGFTPGTIRKKQR